MDEGVVERERLEGREEELLIAQAGWVRRGSRVDQSSLGKKGRANAGNQAGSN